MNAAGQLVVVSGPSGVGKGTVVREALALRPSLQLSVSWTTREPRPGEVDGDHYTFVSRREFRELVESGAMLEYAEFAGNLYGTPRAEVFQRLAGGSTVLLEIDLQGARQIKQAAPAALTVFLRPPSMFELASRLRSRGTEDAETVDRRLRVAEAELASAEEFDVQITNTEVRSCACELLQFIDSAAGI